jgi:hypothetical protein
MLPPAAISPEANAREERQQFMINEIPNASFIGNSNQLPLQEKSSQSIARTNDWRDSA